MTGRNLSARELNRRVIPSSISRLGSAILGREDMPHAYERWEVSSPLRWTFGGSRMTEPAQRRTIVDENGEDGRE